MYNEEFIYSWESKYNNQYINTNYSTFALLFPYLYFIFS